MDSSTLKERAADISKAAEILSDELARLHFPEPSFEHGLPTALHSDAPDSDAAAARQALLQKLDEYRALLTEPTLHLTPELVSNTRKQFKSVCHLRNTLVNLFFLTFHFSTLA